MDELEMLRSVLAKPGPSSETVSRGRRELERTIHRRAGARGRRPSRLVTGIGLIAVTAAGAVTTMAVITSGTAPATRGTTAATRGTTAAHTGIAGHHVARARLSAQQILLTAATTAQRTAEGSGTYWYVRIWAAYGDPRNKLHLAESWALRDGASWIRDEKSGSPPIKVTPAPNVLGPFFLGGQSLRFGQIQDLPTQPAALMKWIVTNAARHGSKSGGPTDNKPQERQEIFDSLTSLISELPAPPKVRAAAFRAMASLPGVRSLGPVKGGQSLQYTVLGGEQATLVIDPSTGQLRYTNFFVGSDGSETFQTVANATISGQWTKTLPK